MNEAEKMIFDQIFDRLERISISVGNLDISNAEIKKDISNIWREIKHLKGGSDSSKFLGLVPAKAIPWIITSVLLGAASVGAILCGKF